MPLTEEQKQTIIKENEQIIAQLQERASFIGPREKEKPSLRDVFRSPEPLMTGMEAIGVPTGLQKEVQAAKGFVTFPHDLAKDIVLPTYKGIAKALYTLPTKGFGAAQKVVEEEVKPHQRQVGGMTKAFGGGVLDWLKMSLLADTPAGIVAKQRIGDRIKEHGYLAEAVHPAVLLGLVRGGVKAVEGKTTVPRIRLEERLQEVAESEIGLPRKVIQDRLKTLREIPEPVRPEMQPVLDQILQPKKKVGLEPLRIPEKTTPSAVTPDFVLGKAGRLMRTTKKRPVKVPEEGMEIRPGERRGPLYDRLRQIEEWEPGISRTRLAERLKQIREGEIPPRRKLALKRKLKAEGVGEETTKFKTYEEAQGAIDTRIDQLMAEGKTFKQADNAPDVVRMYEARNKIAQTEHTAGYNELTQRVNKITNNPELTKKILDDAYSMEPGELGPYFTAEYTADLVSSGKGGSAALRRVLDDIAKREHPGVESASVLFSQASPLTEAGKASLLKRATKQTKAISDAIEDFVFPKETKMIEPPPAPAGKPAPVEGKAISPRREADLKVFADRSIDQVEAGKPAGRTFVWPEAGERGPIQPRITADASTYPQWYRDLTRDYSIKKSQTIKALKQIKEKGMEADGRQYVEAVKEKLLDAMTEERSVYAQEILKERAKRGVLTPVEKELHAFFEKKGKEFKLTEEVKARPGAKQAELAGLQRAEAEAITGQKIKKVTGTKAIKEEMLGRPEGEVLPGQIELKPPAGKPAAKQPWEMSFSEWQKTSVLEGEGPYWGAFHRAIMAKATFKGAQRAALREALAKRERILPEVLAEYPGLGKKVGVKAKLDLAEQKALERMKKRGTRLTTGIDPAEMADLAIIGAAKIAKGTIKFAEWSAEMVREYGARVKPYLKQIWAQAEGHHKRWAEGQRIEESVTNVTEALKGARSVRKQQETLYTKERGTRLARALSVGEKVRGEKGFYAELGQFKGELPKAQFEAIRQKVSQIDIDNLFNKIKDDAVLGDWEKVSARQGLAKLFGEYGGRVPTKAEIALLDKVFGSGFTQVLMSKRNWWAKAKDAGYQLWNVPRSVMASFDLSAPLRQGVFFIGRPKQFLPAFKQGFRYFGSEKAFTGLGETIAQSSYYQLMKDSKLALTEMGRFFTTREEAFFSSWAEKIPLAGPVIRASGRAHTGFLNKMRADVFVDLIRKAEKLGIDPKANRDFTRHLADYINTATGRGSLGKLQGVATALNTFFFSPRLMSSRLKLLNPVYYIKKPPFVRRQALRDLMIFSSTGATLITLAKLGGADAGLDPRNADFGKIKIGKTRIDAFGGFQQYIRAGAQLISGTYVSSTTGRERTLGEGYKPITRMTILGRQLEAKQAPLASFATSLLEGQDWTGQPLNIPKELGKRFVPMVIGDIVELAKEEPELLPLGVLATFGVGLQTYESASPEIRKFYGFLAGVERKTRKVKGLDTREKKVKYIQENKESFRVVGHKANGEPIRLPQLLGTIDRRISKYSKQIRDIESDSWVVDKKPVKLTDKQKRLGISILKQKIEKLAKGALKLKK